MTLLYLESRGFLRVSQALNISKCSVELAGSQAHRFYPEGYGVVSFYSLAIQRWAFQAAMSAWVPQSPCVPLPLSDVKSAGQKILSGRLYILKLCQALLRRDT
ncbi:MAG: hypothetical protein PUP93_32020 [Rhizonema sp. NSF051]|nr:hypothetical protein [Rhizonema sp. NSF051]